MGIQGTLLAMLIALCLATPALAASSSTSSSTANGTGTANNAGIGTSSSGSYSGSTSTSQSLGGTGGAANGTYTDTVNFTYNDPPATSGTSSGSGSSGGDPTINENLRTTGTAIAPSIYNNNVCALGASAAGGFFGGAFALGFDRVDKGCDARAFVSLLGHFAEINSIAAAHATDPSVRALAAQNAVVYAQWANNYLCASNPDLAAAVPPGSNFCKTVATQGGLQVVPQSAQLIHPPPSRPTPVVSTYQPLPLSAYPPLAAAAPPKAIVADAGPPVSHVYGTYETVPTSRRTGPISGYNGPEYVGDDD